MGLYVAFSKDLWYFFKSLEDGTEFLKVKFKILKTDHQMAGIIQVWGMQLKLRQNAGVKNYVHTYLSGGHNLEKFLGVHIYMCVCVCIYLNLSIKLYCLYIETQRKVGC